MSRQLRPRKSKKISAERLEKDSENGLPSSENSSRDEFKPEEEPEMQLIGEDDDLSFLDRRNLQDVDDEEYIQIAGPPKSKKRKRSSGNINLAPGLTRPITRKSYVLPSPSTDHRHRPQPLYRRQDLVERLLETPTPFQKHSIALTNNWTSDVSITGRLNKSFGINVGKGPIWELMEDRAWWKESKTISKSQWEKERRPTVYENLSIPNGWTILDERTASSYVPPIGSSTVKCQFGPLKNSSKHTVSIYDSVDLTELLHDTKAIVFNAGGSVSALDWCPAYCDDLPIRNYRQYLAVGPLPNRTYNPCIGSKRGYHACIQVWCLSPKQAFGERNHHDRDMVPADEDIGRVHCDMVMCIETGSALELKWCPLPSNDTWAQDSQEQIRKLGVLAGIFEDGSLSLFIVPDSSDLRKKDNPEETIYVHMPLPALHIVLEHTSCSTLDWANSETIAVGCTDGSIAVYNVKEAFSNPYVSVGPTHMFSIHQSAVRVIQWIREPVISADGLPDPSEHPVIIASGGYDGCEIFTDIRDGVGNIVNRTRDVINAMTYSTYAIGAISTDNDNDVKVYSVCPNMLGRGHMLLDSGSPIMCVHASDYHPQLAVGSADGTCMTTNILKSTRRSDIVPFLTHRIYQLDYSRQTKEFRMLDQLLPLVFNDKALTQTKQKAGAGKANKSQRLNSAIWPTEVGVLRVVWNTGSGLARAPLLASSTACGLCRIDWLIGRMHGDRQPYGGVDNIRGETSTGEDIDMPLESDSDDSDESD